MWVFLLLMDLLVPVFLIVYGNIYRNKAPKDINGSNGYKTARSRMNRDTWEFANRFAARTMRVAGWILLAFSVAAMLLVRGKDEPTVSCFGVGILLVQIVVLVLSTIPPTEAALKKTFDENGNRRE